MFRKFSIVLIIQFMLVLMMAMPMVYAEDLNDWSVEAIEQAIQLEWIDEDQIAFPQSAITRIEFINLAMRLYESAGGEEIFIEDHDPFDDTQDAAVAKAYALGVVVGTEINKFEPHLEITREQMMVMLYRLLDAMEIYPVTTMEYMMFEDEVAISHWAKNATQLLYKLDVVNGVSEGQIAPKQTATWEQAVVMVARIQHVIDLAANH